ncbi:CopD family protein [Tateyamaria sp. SN3-11]|uniref:CopD family protein n=1 Tax=Tateyamaria sp. SN3-11 TaxID=3092147 RepID=UPI0039ED2945
MPDIWGLAAIATKFALYLGVLTATGTVFAALVFHVQGIRPVAAGFAVLGMLATILGFSLGGATLTGDVGGMSDPEMLGLLWTTPVGTALAYRLVGLGLLMGGLLMGRGGLWLSALGGGLALWSFAAVGHVPDRDMPWLNAVLLFHLAAVALWMGILTPLKRLAVRAAAADAAELGHRFGRMAAVFVPLLVLAGLVTSYVLVGSIGALVGTGYGQVLVVKVVCVAVLLGLAALNKLRFVPQMRGGEVQAAAYLSRSISVEWGAVIAILLVTAVLTSVLTLPS